MLEFKIPEVGENIDTGTVVGLSIAVGDTISKDQDLIELETDKATIPVPAPCDGTITEILIKEGDEVNIGQVVMKIEESNGAPAAAPKEESAPKKAAPGKEKAPAPAAKKAAAPAKKASTSASAPATKSNESIEPQTNVPAAPTVRRFARELGLEISQIQGTGPGGRISKEDVKVHAKGVIQSGGGASSSGAAISTPPLPDFSKHGEITREKMNNIRKKTATHLSSCWNTIPHVTQFDKADITDLEKLRKKYSTPDRKLTITPFLLKVMAAALKQFPQFNASVDMENKEIIYKEYYNLGVAVDTERGLLVPVVKDVDQKSVFDLADELNEMAQRARDKKTGLDELSGGCMTLTNLGGIGGTSFTPIVNWPEVSILGVSRGGWEPIYENGQFIPRFKIPFSLSYDHRIIDGADGARFLRWICEAIEQPFMMELENK